VDRLISEDALVANWPAGASASEDGPKRRWRGGFPDGVLGPLGQKKVLEEDPLA
jgi:hypothetical protein